MKNVFSSGVIAILLLTGCGNSETTVSQERNKPAEYISPLPDNTPIIKVATTGTQPPFSFQDEYGNMIGIDIDAIRAIGEQAGFKVEFYKEPWQNIFPSVVAGQRDLAISGISYSDERAKNYLLSDSYLFVPSAIMYKNPALNIKGLSDLKGLHFGGMQDAKQIGDVIASRTPNVKITSTKTVYLAYEKLIRGEVDAIAEDIQWLEFTAKQYPQYQVQIVPYENKSNPVAHQVIMMKKGNDELARKVNASIAKLKQTDEFSKIEKKWLDDYKPTLLTKNKSSSQNAVQNKE